MAESSFIDPRVTAAAAGDRRAAHELLSELLPRMRNLIRYLIRGDDLVFKRDVHLGMAVAIEDPEPGLMVPVIKNADQMNLRGLARSGRAGAHSPLW